MGNSLLQGVSGTETQHSVYFCNCNRHPPAPVGRTSTSFS